MGGPNISWMNDRCKKIVLFIIDDTIDDETAELFKTYCQAYFLGADIELVKPGSKIVTYKSRDGKTVRTKNVPEDFLGSHKIANRINDFSAKIQYNASEINTALKEYKTGETFCILGVTNQDLYPRDEWNFVFGQANTTAGTGIFSFCRHAVDWGVDPDVQLDIEPEEARLTWLKRSCSTMVHEITHMFGIKHCIYYECTMNGSNGSHENRGPRTLCPSCLIKLQMNMKFKVRWRYQVLAEASAALGFEGESAFY